MPNHVSRPGVAGAPSASGRGALRTTPARVRPSRRRAGCCARYRSAGLYLAQSARASSPGKQRAWCAKTKREQGRIAKERKNPERFRDLRRSANRKEQLSEDFPPGLVLSPTLPFPSAYPERSRWAARKAAPRRARKPTPPTTLASTMGGGTATTPCSSARAGCRT